MLVKKVSHLQNVFVERQKKEMYNKTYYILPYGGINSMYIDLSTCKNYRFIQGTFVSAEQGKQYRLKILKEDRFYVK